MEKIELKRILFIQKNEIQKVLEDRSIIQRDCIHLVEKYIDTDLIKVITGVRRCGKSILSLQIITKRNYAYINFDDERLFKITTEDLNNILEILHEIYGNFKYLFIDEIQNIEDWELFVNRCRRQGYNILITGSNAKLLSKELATHLTGRFIEIELYPFSFKEFLKYFGLEYSMDELYLPEKVGEIKKYMNKYIETGGFPEVLKYPETETRYLADMYNAILGKDIITRYNIRFSKSLRDISTYLISNHSCEISYNKLKNIFDIKSSHTTENYVFYIEEAYLIFQLFPFSFKVKEQLRGSKKIYAIDTGLINAISSRSFDNTGRLMENIVFLELMRERSETPFEMYFYKSSQQEEVDFVIKKGLKITRLIQVCYSMELEKTRMRELKALIKASLELNCTDLLVITWDYEAEEEEMGKNIRFLPLWKWLLKDIFIREVI